MSVYSQQSSNVRRTWLLMFIFIGLVSALFFGLSTYYKTPILGIIGLIISLGQAAVAYFFGDKIALSTAGGKIVTYEQAPQIHEMVNNLSKIAGIKTPQIYISPDSSANAFACGRDPEHASICLNQGLIDILDKNELEGVIAHELSHVSNRDILVMTVTSVLTGVVAFISDIGLRMMWFGGSSDDDDNRSPLIFVFYIVLIVVAPIVSLLISMAVSRQREYLADATAITMTRYPNGLINALQKLYKSPIPSEHYSSSTNHFYISPPKKNFGEKAAGLFSTHPSIEDRVKALSKM